MPRIACLLALLAVSCVPTHAFRVHCGVAHTTDYKTQNAAQVCGAYVEVTVYEYARKK